MRQPHRKRHSICGLGLLALLLNFGFGCSRDDSGAKDADEPEARIAVGGRVDRVPDHRDYGLERFNGVETPLIKPPVIVPQSDKIVLSGWAVDREGGKPAAKLEVVIDGKAYSPSYGHPRNDVADFLGLPGVAASGFSFEMPAAGLAPGRHELRLRIFVGGGDAWLESAVFPFEVR